MRYQLPPSDVVELLDAPPIPFIIPSPDARWLAVGYCRGLATIHELSRPMLRLAGRRIDPKTNGRYVVPSIVRLGVVDVETGREAPVQGLEGGLGFPAWAPNGDSFALTRTTDRGIELWIVHAASGNANPITEPELNGARGDPFLWMPGSDQLVCHFVDSNRGSPPSEPEVPLGPIVQESSDQPSPARTYQDLLEEVHDEALYDYYLTSQPALVDARSGSRQDLGLPAIYETLAPSPDGAYFLAVRTVRPYSYLVPDQRFPKAVEVWDSTGHEALRIADLTVDEKGPEHLGYRRDGARSFSWRACHPATLAYVEALDGGDPERQVPHRDRLLLLNAPFDGEPKELIRTEHRTGSRSFGRGPSVLWCADGETAIVFEYDWSTRRARAWLAHASESPDPPAPLWDRSSEDWYGDPGHPLTTTTPRGEVVVRQAGDHIYLVGQGGTPEGDRPFLDRFNPRTLEAERVFQCGPDCYEYVVALLDDEAAQILTRRETPSEPPNFHVVDTRTGFRRSVTAFSHPQPILEAVRKRRIHYERRDGVPLTGDLYLPPEHEPGDRRPVLVWAYPREYADEVGAGQVRGSPNRFTFISGASHLVFLTCGYAVLDDASMPIVGGLRANDTYVDQLVANGQAAVDKLVELEVADPERIGIAGHSYGAFMTANLLAHSSLFAAGIARSGAFNRSLTPFGFQFERRSFWDAPEVYHQMSPFMHADQIEAPLLLIHGLMDDNPGTYPIQSERLFHAMKGLGRIVRLVLLPNESHGYRARESVLHTVWEMLEWMQRHLGSAAMSSE